MFANLSIIILYLWAINNNIHIPIIIPILIILRDLALLLPKNNILINILNLHGTNLDIEYYLAILSSILLIIYYYYFQTNKIVKHYLKLIFSSVIVIYILFLIVNFFIPVRI